MIPFLRSRAGIPRFARRLRDGEPASLVAFGTSQTLAGAYLDRLPAALRAAHGRARVAIVNRGRKGCMTLGAAFRVADDVLPHAPDLVIIEFAHNDVTQDVLDYIPSALEGIIAQIRAAAPACEFVFVYLALHGTAAGGPTPAIEAYENIADHYGIPSIDLAALSEDLVARGQAIWFGDETRALTVDGIHHGPAAAGLLGDPFARGFLELLETDGAGAAALPAPDWALSSVTRVQAADYLSAGAWAVRSASDAERRGAGSGEELLAEALEPGATVRLTFAGTNAFAWVSGSGVLGVRIAETDERYRVGVEADAKWNLRSLIVTHAPARYTLEVIALNAGLLFGDFGLVGTME